MAGWKKSTYKLDANHKWKSKPGYSIFVANWGAVQFCVPSKWVALPQASSFRFCDKQPPDDDCTLEVSVAQLPPIDWSDLSLAYLLEEVLKNDERDEAFRGEIIRETRDDWELAWTETRFVEGPDRRPARSRTCLARRGTVQPLITMDFWLDDAEKFVPVWEEALSTLKLAEPDPHLMPKQGR